MGSGPVTISAKTRLRKYSHADADYQFGNTPSCKHMCCREGVDKAPKAPKTSFVSAASLVDSSHLLGHVGNYGRVATVKKSAAPSVPRNEQEAEIETVDLASGQTFGRYERTPPKSFRSLDLLHENVTRGRTAPVAIGRKPSFDYVERGQPQISYPNTNGGGETSSDKQSTDYDADWMGDLPSPSALLGKQREKVGPLPTRISTDDGGSWRRQNDAAPGNYPGRNSLEDLDSPQLNDDESEIEAAMVGLNDSVTMQHGSQVQAATSQTSPQTDAYPKWSPPPDESTPKLYHCPTIKGESSGTSRLFLSADNPEKTAALGQKRKASVRDQAEDLSQSAPVPKRPRVSHEHDQPPIPSSSAQRQTLSPTPIVKPGQPAWVYEFDAAFVAEWQDIVDFV